MKLSTKGRYAVMAMTDLAMSGAERPVPLGDIASRQEISLSYLEQLFAKLRRAGVVKSVRGPGGGYRLARAAGETRIADIMLAVEEPVDVTRCQHKPAGCLEGGRRCVTHDLWDELGRHIHLFLNGVTLEDVLERRVLGMSTAAESVVMLEQAAE
jgi:Rrf2 family iron-sulfur cluster assembly transcriptional regulator